MISFRCSSLPARFVITLLALAPTHTPAQSLSCTGLYSQFTIAAGSWGWGSAVCPAGKMVVAGQWSSNDAYPYPHVYQSYPSGNAWYVGAFNPRSTAATMSVYAACCTGTPAITCTSYWSNAVSVAGGAWADASVACPAGTLTLGGGFYAGYTMEVHRSEPDALASSWATRGLNTSAASSWLWAIATCCAQ